MRAPADIGQEVLGLKYFARLFLLWAALALTLNATVLHFRPERPWAELRRDGEMEAFAEVLFGLTGKPMRVPVVIDPGGHGWCAYASKYGDQAYIGIDKACVGRLRIGNSYNWEAVSVMAHEVGHIVLRHIEHSGNHFYEEADADEWSGWAMHKLGATLEQALVRAAKYNVKATATHPERSVRFEAYARGWMKGKSGLSHSRPKALPQRSWWAEFMQRPLPWVR